MRQMFRDNPLSSVGNTEDDFIPYVADVEPHLTAAINFMGRIQQKVQQNLIDLRDIVLNQWQPLASLEVDLAGKPPRLLARQADCMFCCHVDVRGGEFRWLGTRATEQIGHKTIEVV